MDLRILPVAAVFFATVLPAAAAPADAAYRGSIEAWQKTREARLRAEDGWLAVSGLFWLKEGENPFGAAPNNVILLPNQAAPARAGVIIVSGRKLSVRLEPGVSASVGEVPVTGVVALRADTAEGGPDTLKLGRLTLFPIERGGRLGIRLRDPEAATRRDFRGLQFFPIDSSWRLTGRYVAYDAPRTLNITNVLGQVEKMVNPGEVTVSVNGQDVLLRPVLEAPDAKQLFFIFRDGTAAKETYGAGRFLYTDLPKDGAVVLDFNKAYSPPCAFTRYATCPLPPSENKVTVRIEAGEKKPAGLH